MLPLPNPSFPEPLVIQVLREYRARMDGMEVMLMDDMARRWLEMERVLDADITALAYEFERRAKAGEVITQQMIWKSERYKLLKARMQVEIAKFNIDAAKIVTAAQVQYATLGIEAAQNAILASYSGAPALASAWTRINIEAVQAMIGLAGDGSPLLALLKKDYGDAANGLLDSLIQGLARGLGPAQIAANMRDGFGMGLDRALLISRTEAARAYRTGSAEQYRKSGVVVKFMRLCKKETACMACLALDGQVLEIDEELSDHPCGKCQILCVVEGVPAPKWQTGIEWFALQTDTKQREIMGAEKWKLWKDEGFDLSRFAREDRSDVWGIAPRVATLEELRQ